MTAVQFDVSPRLSEMRPVGRAGVSEFEAQEGLGLREMFPPRHIPHAEGLLPPGREDPIRQRAAPVRLAPTPSHSFDGQGEGFTGPAGAFAVAAAPPDTNGDVGPNHFVQIVNLSLAVFDKTGTVLFGPANTNTLWSGFGGGCENNNDGDPVVQYDQLADRWILSQFSVTSGPPFFECVAVSASPDPTGSYNRYSFQFSNFNDYPKMGVWPDAYYFTFNDFDPSLSSFVGGEICAFDRNRMIQGASATAQCFLAGSAFGGLMPADLDGAMPPPAGAPDYVVALGSDVLHFWTFHVDFTTPANSAFTGPTDIAVASFSGANPTSQPGTGETLDVLSDRLMYRLAYRNYGDHESLVVNHSVTAGGGANGVRWYELRSPGTTPTVFQQGTFAPDATSRWMGSAAMDHVGNLAIGFTASSASVHPGVRFAGREAGDPSGELTQGEGTLVDGAGSQTDGLSRWGDYSALTVDPVDDCTFWFTSEYMASSGTFNWRTRIGSFRFASCDTLPPTTSISAPPDGAVVKGTTTITADASDDSTVAKVEFYVDGTLLTMSASAPFSADWDTTKVGDGPHMLTTKAYDAANNNATSSVVNVRVQNDDFSLSPSPASHVVRQGGTAAYAITTAVTGGNAQTITFSTTDLPAGVTGSFDQPTVMAGGSATLTLQISQTAAIGLTSFTISGMGTSSTHTVPASLDVRPPGNNDGSLGSSCTGNEQCDSNLCIMDPQSGRQFCSAPCTASCAAGYQCTAGMCLPSANGEQVSSSCAAVPGRRAASGAGGGLATLVFAAGLLLAPRRRRRR